MFAMLLEMTSTLVCWAIMPVPAMWRERMVRKPFGYRLASA
jgi:hypothetical protein